jgi:transcription elongation GreA/GreB family factor
MGTGAGERQGGDMTAQRAHDGDTDRVPGTDPERPRLVAFGEAGPATGDVVLGAVVTVQDETSGQIATYEIEGEVAPLGMRISAASPVGAALLGRAVGDLVTISLPRGRTRVVRVVGVSASRDAQQ